MIWEAVNAVVAGTVAVGTGVLGWAGAVEKRLRDFDDRLDDVERRQSGDQDDPNVPGLLEQVHDLERDVEQVDAKLERAREERQTEHQHVMDRLDQLEDKIDA